MRHLVLAAWFFRHSERHWIALFAGLLHWSPDCISQPEAFPIHVRGELNVKLFAISWLLFLGVLFGGRKAALADPVTYTYIGSAYTQTNQPYEAGFTLNDRITGFLTIDSSQWGTGRISTNSFALFSGSISAGTYSAVLTTDADGTILSWSVDAEKHGGWDLVTQGNADGSGLDYNGDAGVPLADGTSCVSGCLSEVKYQSGVRDPGTGWSRITVPEPSNLALLVAGMAGIIVFRLRMPPRRLGPLRIRLSDECCRWQRTATRHLLFPI